MRGFRSILLVALGIRIELSLGLTIDSRSWSEPPRCIPALRNVDATFAQWQSETETSTTGALAVTNTTPITK
jgi:hypothetical protein